MTILRTSYVYVPLAAVGIFSCLCGSIIGIGFSLLFGFTYTALSGLIPFICLGIGIDDMFVIMRCFDNIPDEDRGQIHLKIAPVSN